MRQVLNVSLPASTVKFVKQSVKDHGYASTSEFIRALIRQWQEDQLLKDIDAGRKEFAAGKTKMLKSLKELV